MQKTISITNQKGGVGKTTTAINMVAAMGNLGKKVLMIDMDPQGNATSGIGLDKRQVNNSIYNVMIDGVEIENTIVHTPFKNVDVIPSSINLAAAEIELVNISHRESTLRTALESIKNMYDYIIIDCPPSLGLVTTNALCASDTVLLPIQCEYYALEGLSQLISTAKRVQRQYNHKLDIEGILLTMYDKRLRLTNQVVEEIKKHFPNKVFNTMIPRSVRLSEAPSYGKPIIYFDRWSKGSMAYINLAKEILRNNSAVEALQEATGA